MSEVNVNDFNVIKDCIFEEERYSVRDNGSVFRHPQPGKRARANDNVWTFGKPNSQNPYLHIASARIHRIVATAFHGDPPEPSYVVDHIDSNGRNNRPENLRWLTRLENTLKNPTTRKKIEYLCGSVEAFLANPSMLHEMNLEPNIAWMRAVTIEEAANCKARMDLWARSPNSPPPSSGKAPRRRRAYGDSMFQPIAKWEVGLSGEPGLDFAETPMCAQYMWHGSYFPLCPQEIGISALGSYFENIKIGDVFSYGDHSPKLVVLDTARTKLHPSIIVLCESSGSKPYAMCAITLNEYGYFIHFVIGTYSNKDSADKAFATEQELSKFSSDGYNGFREH